MYPSATTLFSSSDHSAPLEKWLKEGAFVKFVRDNVNKRRGVCDVRSGHQAELFSLLVVRHTSNLCLISTLSHSPHMKFHIYSWALKTSRPLSKSYLVWLSQKNLSQSTSFTNTPVRWSEVVVLDVLHKNEHGRPRCWNVTVYTWST